MPSLRRSFQQAHGSSDVVASIDNSKKRRVTFLDNLIQRTIEERQDKATTTTTTTNSKKMTSHPVGNQFDDPEEEEEDPHFPRLDPGCEPSAGSEEPQSSNSKPSFSSPPLLSSGTIRENQQSTATNNTKEQMAGVAYVDPTNTSAREQPMEIGKQEAMTETEGAQDSLVPIEVEGDQEEANKEQEEKIRRMTSFFHSEPFTKDEYHEVAKRVKDRFDAPLKLVEEKGFSVFQEWRNKALNRGVNAAEQKKKAEETLVADAKIVGAPRAYQRALFEIAKQRNAIIALPTGSGKTLISLLCIKHWADAFQEGKQTLFMVPSVALAIQQSSTLKANLPYSVQVACYATCMGSNYRQELKNCNIIVATHGAVLDLLMHYQDLFSMDRFNFLVVDECHYATGNHAYASLMKRFYHPLPVEKRPRVLGLTASPLVRVKPNHTDEYLSKMLSALEHTLDATVVSLHGLKEGRNEMSDDSSSGKVQEDKGDKSSGDSTSLRKSAEEKVLRYTKYPSWATIPPVEAFPMHQSRIREFQQIYGLYEELGPLALSIYCQTVAREVSRNTFEKESSREFQAFFNHLKEVARFCSKLCQNCPRGGRTDKLLALEELLEEQIEDCGTSETVGLVFVERRVTALCLADYFRFRQTNKEKSNWIRAAEARKRVPNMRAPSPMLISIPQTASVAPSFQRSISPASSSEMSLSNGSIDQFANAESVASPNRPSQSQPMFDMNQVARSGSRVTKNSSPAHSDRFTDADEDELHDLEAYSDIQVDRAKNAASGKEEQEIAERNLKTPSVASGQFVDPESVSSVGTAASSCSKEIIRCRALVRHSTQIFKSMNLSRRLGNDEDEVVVRKTWLHQESRIRDVLNGLRRGEINLLIATSVVEEGVDVQACSFVVAFDSLKNAKAYIQMRGRARQEAAQFFVFHDPDSQSKNALVLHDAQHIERRVDQFIAARSHSFPKPEIHELEDFSGGASSHSEISALEFGGYNAEHGFVDLQSATSLINRYALSLPLDALTRSDKLAFQARLPVYMPDQNQLLLPAHLPRDLRVITLPKKWHGQPTKMKHQLLALMGCVRLHQNGLFSERLLPLTQADLKEKMAQAARSALSVEIPRSTFKPFSTNGANSRKLIVYPIVLNNTRMESLSNKILKHNGQVLAVISTHSLEVIPEMKEFHPVFGSVTCSLGQGFSFDCTEDYFDIILQFFALVMNARWRRRSKSLFHRPLPLQELSTLIPPYYVGCLNATHNQVDWDYMTQLVKENKRSREERRQAVRDSSDVDALPKPRLWVPSYDEAFTYISYGPSGRTCADKFPTPSEEDGIMTYQDYFKIKRDHAVGKDCQLFDAQRLWSLPFNKTSVEGEVDDETFVPKLPAGTSDHSNRWVVCTELRSLHLPKDGCSEASMACPNLLLMSTFLPQFLYHIEPFVVARSFIQHCRQHMPRLGECLGKLPIHKVVEALTAKSCAKESSYEKLEYFGDAVLKLVQTDCLINSRLSKNLHEGDLSSLRSEMGCNDRLQHLCKNLKINEFILTAPLGRSHWTPGSLELFFSGCPSDGTGTYSETEAAGKTCADVMEALLGLAYLCDGYATAKAVADELQVTVKTGELKVSSNEVAPKPNLIAAATSFTGQNVFNRHELVEEAFTHPTAMHPEVPSYQRLEWIGDAVLCLAVREWLVLEFKEADVGKLVSMEASLVANETLGFLAISHGIQRFLNHCESSLPSKIEFFEWSVEDRGRGLWGTEPPKVTADIVEALIGAVYLDSGFISGIRAVHHILHPMMKGLEQIHLSKDGFVLTHPKKALQEFGGSLLHLSVTKEYTFAALNAETPVWLGKRWGVATAEGNKYVASVECLGFNIISVADASPEVAGNRAGAFTVALLREHPDMLRRLRSNRTLIESTASKQSKQSNSKKKKKAGEKRMADSIEGKNIGTSAESQAPTIAFSSPFETKGCAVLAEMEIQSVTTDERNGPFRECGLEIDLASASVNPAADADMDNDAAMSSVIESMLRNVFATSDNDDDDCSDGDSSKDLFAY